MPYILPQERKDLDPTGMYGQQLDEADGPGQLNFQITRLVAGWLGDSPTYAVFNAAIGVLECAKLELYRRMVAPYEDQKLSENGDVYS